MTYTCEKCAKTFITKYHLIRHTSRKTPCTKQSGFKCEKCNKIFKARIHLKSHLNRKRPCQANIIEEKIVQNELTFEQQIKIIDHKTESEIKILEKKKELIETKKKAVLEIEKEKTSRKIQTPHVVNNYKDSLHLEIHELKILNAIYPAKNIHNANLDCLQKIIPIINKCTEDQEIIEFMCKDKELADINTELIEKTYNNEALPTQRNMIYSDESKSFYMVKDSSWIESDFENIKELLSQTLHKYYRVLYKKSASLSKPTDKSQEVYIKIKELSTKPVGVGSGDLKDLEDTAMKALNHTL
jgi:hypothetical protein